MQYAITASILPMVIKLWWDMRLWMKRKPVNHGKEWLWLAASEIPAIVMFASHSQAGIFVSMALPALFIAFGIWFAFNLLYNILRGYPPFFAGSDDPDDPVTDDILQKLKPWQRPIVQLVPFTIALILYILTL